LDLICQKSTNITKIPVDELALGTCAFFFFMPAYTDEKASYEGLVRNSRREGEG